MFRLNNIGFWLTIFLIFFGTLSSFKKKEKEQLYQTPHPIENLIGTKGVPLITPLTPHINKPVYFNVSNKDTLIIEVLVYKKWRNRSTLIKNDVKRLIPGQQGLYRFTINNKKTYYFYVK